MTHFLQVVDFVQQQILPACFQGEKKIQHTKIHPLQVDFKDVKGHLLVKRALMIAAAGMHNILMV